MASSVHERKSSVGNVSNLATQRRYSRVYDQPILQHTSKGPMVRVETDDAHSESSTGLTSDEYGKMLNPEAYTFGSVLAKVALTVLILLGLVTSCAGRTFLMAVSQLFGFTFIFTVTFVVCSGLYLWWGAWNGNTVQLSVKKVITLYVICCSCDFLARALASFASIPVADSLPIAGSYFIFLLTNLFVTFSLFAHKDGLNAMFSKETSMFVGLTLLLNFSSTCLFGEIIPSILLSQLVYGGILLGLSLSLMAHRFPHLSLSAVYRVFNQHESSYRNSLAPPTGRRLSKTSMGSMGSAVPSARSRASLSSISSLLSLNPQLTGVDSEVINEAHGLISDLLMLKESLNDNTRQKLRKIRELLAPKIDKTVAFNHHKVIFGDDIADEHDYENDVVYTPSDYTPSDISYAPSDVSCLSSGGNSSNKLHPSVRKNRSTSVVLRRSSSRFSTTTTASGMPVLDNEPVNRHRSIALRDVRARISVQEKRNSVHKIGRDRIGSHDGRYVSHDSKHKPQLLSPLTRTRSPGISPKVSDSDISMASVVSVTSNRSTSQSHLRSVDEKDITPTITDVKESANRQPVATPPQSPKMVGRSPSQDLNKIEEREELDWTPRPRSYTEPAVKLSPLSGQLEQKESPPSNTEEEAGKKKEEEEETGQGLSEVSQVARFNQRPANGYIMFAKYKYPNMDYDVAVYAESLHNELEVFENVGLWDFPIFELEEKASDHILSHMAYVVFHEAGLMETFQIPQREFINFFRVLEVNYGSNVYHNKTHAADVLHAVSYLIFEMIPEFSHEFSDDTRRVDWKGYSRKGTSGNIASAFSILEVFACFMAAAMHDFDHPGRTNAFLVATQSPLAVLYNDRSVLENHHAATSWDLLTQLPSNNFLTSLDGAEKKRFRFLVIEAILATDLKMHFDILSEFKAKVNPEEGGGIDWHSEVDRLMVMKMIIKMADINTPTKSFDLHRSWTKRITEEFYQQSDEETSLDLPGTIFMDRNHPEKLPAIQLSFIQHLVSPLFQGCAEAGIIPGILVPADTSDSPTSSTPLTEPGKEGEAGESESKTVASVVDDLDVGDDAFALDTKQESTSHKFMSLILTNLHVNYEGWRAELPKEEDEEKKEIEDGDKEDKVKDPEGGDSEEKEGTDRVGSQDGVAFMIIPTVTVEEDSS